MIEYESGPYQCGFMMIWQGSTYLFAFTIAFPSSLLSFLLKYYEVDEWSLLEAGGSAAWSGFTFLVGFVIVFRTSQAYSRFWGAINDTHTMLAEWFDASSSLVAWTKHSTVSIEEVDRFLHLAVRLFSILSACALQELSDVENQRVNGLDTLDVASLDYQTVKTLDEAATQAQSVELVYQWIQQLLVDGCQNNIVAVAPPIVGRTFTELAAGMSKWQDAMKCAKVPFPLPYAQTTTVLLMFHWILCPLAMTAWTQGAPGAAIFTFIQVFTVWSLNTIAMGFEKPFGGNWNDIDTRRLQRNMNRHLLLLLETTTRTTPVLEENALVAVDALRKGVDTIHKAALLKEGWEPVELEGPDMVNEARWCRRCCCCLRSCRCWRKRSRRGRMSEKQQVAVAKNGLKRYGKVDGETTAVLTVGIFQNELVLALPAKARLEHGERILEVLNTNREKCLVRIKKIQFRQRHGLHRKPDPAWEEVPLAFPKGYTFRNEDLAVAYFAMNDRARIKISEVELDKYNKPEQWRCGEENKVEGVAEQLRLRNSGSSRLDATNAQPPPMPVTPRGKKVARAPTPPTASLNLAASTNSEAFRGRPVEDALPDVQEEAAPEFPLARVPTTSSIFAPVTVRSGELPGQCGTSPKAPFRPVLDRHAMSSEDLQGFLENAVT